jgi:hypothetical protein
MGLVETFSKKETKVRTPDVESQEKDQSNKPIELVNTERVKDFVVKMRNRIDKSPVAKKYQDKIHKKLNKLLKRRDSEVKKSQVDTEASLAQLTSSIKEELDSFDKSTGIDEAHKLVSNKEEVKKVFNLETYKKRGRYWTSINSKLQRSLGIDEAGVRKLQELVHLDPDGRVGPATINKFSEVFDLGVDPVKYGNETRYVDESKSEEAKAVEAVEVVEELVSGVKDSVDSFRQGIERRREWGKLGVPSVEKEALIKLYGDSSKALNKVKTISKYVPNDVRMMVGLASKLEKINSEQKIALICNYFNRFKNEGVTFFETVEWIRKAPRVEEAISFHKAIEASDLAESVVPSFAWVEIDRKPENLIGWVSALAKKGFSTQDSYTFLVDAMKSGGIMSNNDLFEGELSMFEIKYEASVKSALSELRIPDEILDDEQFMKPLTDLYNLKVDHGLDLVKSVKTTESVFDLKRINNFYMDNLRTPKGKVVNDFLRHLVDGADLVDFESVEKFFGDEMIFVCFEVYEKMGGEKAVGKALKIGRNLYMRGQRPGNVTAEQIRAVENLAKNSLGNLKGMPVYEGRRVLFVSQREDWSGGESDGQLRFGHEKMVKGLERSVGEDGKVEHFMAKEDPSKEDLVKMKAKILDQVKNTPPPFTFYFDGHGFAKALVLYDDKIKGLEPHEFISVAEFSAAVKYRANKFGSDYEALNKDLYIIGSCKNHSFIRGIMRIVGEDSDFKKNSGFIGASEFGQPSFSDRRWSRSDNKKVMKVGEKGVTVGDVAEAEKEYSSSDVSIYIPGQDGIPTQVAEVEKIGGSRMS